MHDHTEDLLHEDLKPQTKVVGSGPGGKDPVDNLPDYSDDGEERPIRRAEDVRRAQLAALSEKDLAEAREAEKPKAAPKKKPARVKAEEKQEDKPEPDDKPDDGE